MLPFQQLVVFPVSLVHAHLAVRHPACHTHQALYSDDWLQVIEDTRSLRSQKLSQAQFLLLMTGTAHELILC